MKYLIEFKNDTIANFKYFENSQKPTRAAQKALSKFIKDTIKINFDLREIKITKIIEK